MKPVLLIFSLLVFCFSSSLANGFQVLLQGNRQAAMGNMGVGLRPDPSSIFWNPGALSMMDGNGIQFGANFIFSQAKYFASHELNSNYVAESDNPTGTPFHIYGVWGPEGSKLKFGLGIYTPYGSRVNWGDEWKGKAFLNEIELTSIFFQPTVSYKISDVISVGAGFVYAIGDVRLIRSIPNLTTGGGDGKVDLHGTANGFGYNLGVYIQPNDQWGIGINYRSKVEIELNDGEAKFDVPNFLINDQGFPANNSFQATLPLPANLAIGASYIVSEKLTLALSATLTAWSAYKALAFDFTQNTPRLQDSSSPRNYEDSWSFNLGGEYKLTGKVALRAGYYFDQTPVKEGFITAETPSANRSNFTAGVGYEINEKFSVDASFVYISIKDRSQSVASVIEAGTAESTLPGTYDFNSPIVGASVTYRF